VRPPFLLNEKRHIHFLKLHQSISSGCVVSSRALKIYPSFAFLAPCNKNFIVIETPATEIILVNVAIDYNFLLHALESCLSVYECSH